MIVCVSFNNWYSEVLVNMTPQIYINAKTKAIIISCSLLIRWRRRWFHCFIVNSRPCTWDMSNDVCVHEPVKSIIHALEKLMYSTPFVALENHFSAPDSTPLLALPGCAPTQQYLLLFFLNTWFCVPLANDCCCVDAHDLIALHMLWPSFIRPSDSFLGSHMKTGNVSPGQMKCRPSKALFVSATHKLPSHIWRQNIPLQDEFYCMASSVISPPSHTTVSPDIIWSHKLNFSVWRNITYLYIFEIFNLFIMLLVGIGASLMFHHLRSRFVWFVFMCTCSNLGPSWQWIIGFIHVAPRWMQGLSHPAHDFTDHTHLLINVAICVECCVCNMWTFCIVVVSEVLFFKGCISRSVVKSSGIWEATHSITSGLPQESRSTVSSTAHPKSRMAFISSGCPDV